MSEAVRDLAHLSHVELLTPRPDESLHYFRELLGMEVSGQAATRSTCAASASTSARR